MITFPKEEVISLCLKYGPLLRVPDALKGSQLMAAIASNESSLGANCGPRHEPAYDVGGAYAGNPTQAALLREYGSAAACSYGPWQVMFINCPGYSPQELETCVDDCARAFVAYFNSYVIKTRNAQTLDEIGQVYNAGHISENPALGVVRYVSDLTRAYASLEVA